MNAWDPLGIGLKNTGYLMKLLVWLLALLACFAWLLACLFRLFACSFVCLSVCVLDSDSKPAALPTDVWLHFGLNPKP